jgi:hypothetical protein
MEQTIEYRSVHSICARAVPPFLLILFCLFRYEHFHYSTPTVPAPSRAVCEQVETALPCYDFPQLIDGATADAAISTASTHSPPFRQLFRHLERSYSIFTALRLHLFDGKVVPIQCSSYFHCRRFPRKESSGETPPHFFS